MVDESPVAIVTGGAQGIGAAICKSLLKEGYSVCVADIQIERGKDFVKELQRQYGDHKIIYSHCDVTKEENLDETFRQTIKTFEKVNVLVNNAGITKEEYPKTVIATNLMSVIYGCKMAFRYMGKSHGIGNGGFVISSSSVAGLVGNAISPVYVAVKHGIIGLTRSYGQPYHFEKDGIIFAAICPTLVDTDLPKSIRTKYPISKLDKLDLESMSPDYIGESVLKILKDRINGSTMLITKEDGYQYIGLHKEFKDLFAN